MPTPLRIALVVSQYPPVVGGSEIATQRLGAALARRGHTVTVITQAHAGCPDESVEHGVRVLRTIRPLAVGPLWGATYMRQIGSELRRRGPFDVIHCRQAYLHSVVAQSIAAASGSACLSTICATGPILDLRMLARHRFAPLLLRRACAPPATFVALSALIESETRAFLAERGLSAPVERVPNFVDTAHFHPGPERALPPVAVYVGRLVPGKNTAALLDAFARATTDGVEGRLLLVGGGSEEQALRAQAQSLGIAPRVEFAGRHGDVRPFLWRAGFAVSATLGEGFSNALLEQVSCGLPAVMPDVGGARDVLGEPHPTQGLHLAECGILAAPGDTGSLAHAMRAMFTDPGLRTGLGAAARSRAAREFSEPVVLAGLESVYERALRHAREKAPS